MELHSCIGSIQAYNFLAAASLRFLCGCGGCTTVLPLTRHSIAMNIPTHFPGDGGGNATGGTADDAITRGPATEPAEAPVELGRELDGIASLTDEQALSVLARVIQPQFLHVRTTLDWDVVHRMATSFLACFLAVTESPSAATTQLPGAWSTVADTIQLSGATHQDAVTTSVANTQMGGCLDGATTQLPGAAAPGTTATNVAAIQLPVTFVSNLATIQSQTNQEHHLQHWPIPPDTLRDMAGHLAHAYITESISVINAIVMADATHQPCAICTSKLTQLTNLLHPTDEATELATALDAVSTISSTCNCAINEQCVDRTIRILRDAVVQRIRSHAKPIDSRPEFERLFGLACGNALDRMDEQQVLDFWAQIHLAYSKNPYCRTWGFSSNNDETAKRRGKPRPRRRDGHTARSPKKSPHASMPYTTDDDDCRDAGSGACSSMDPAFVNVAEPPLPSADSGYHIHHHHHIHHHYTNIIARGEPLTIQQQGDDAHPPHHNNTCSVGPTGGIFVPPLYDPPNVSRTTPANQQSPPGVGLAWHAADMHSTSVRGLTIIADALDDVHDPLLTCIPQEPVMRGAHNYSHTTDQPCTPSDVDTHADIDGDGAVVYNTPAGSHSPMLASALFCPCPYDNMWAGTAPQL